MNECSKFEKIFSFLALHVLFNAFFRPVAFSTENVPIRKRRASSNQYECFIFNRETNLPSQVELAMQEIRFFGPQTNIILAYPIYFQKMAAPRSRASAFLQKKKR